MTSIFDRMFRDVAATIDSPWARAHRSPRHPAHEDRDAFLANLDRESRRHPALRHPWLSALAEARLPDMHGAFVDFARVYHGYSSWFPRCLRTVLSKLDDADHRRLLGDLLAKECGRLRAEDRDGLVAKGIDPATVDGIPHAALLRRFCRALGVAAETLQSPPAIADRWRTRLRNFLRGATPAGAVGAITFGTEGVARHLFRHYRAGVRAVPGLKRRDLAFFELHGEQDPAPRDSVWPGLKRIARDFAATPADREALRQGMLLALDLRLEVWDRLWELATGRGEVMR